jgi:8-oxo-dGTP pyrophosphatase MutT (NUDIX family)
MQENARITKLVVVGPFFEKGNEIFHMIGGGAKVREGTSAILISRDGRLLFQLRDNIPDIADPGKLDFFGGGRQSGESFLDCVVREVHEEIGLYLAPEQFEFLGRNVEPDHWVPDCILHNEIFLARDIPIERLTITEGSLRIVGFDELEHIQDLLAPSGKRALEVFLKHEQGLPQRESR